jgi:alpha-galactosidase
MTATKNVSMPNIVILGSSTGWTPTLAWDLMLTFDEPIEFRLVDIDPKPARLCAEWGKLAAKHLGRGDRFIPCPDRRKALKGADAVIITLSTGGLDAMEKDIKIPEKYGIFATVGDTAGPSGWARSIRNIPVFREFADDFEKLCPTAFIANYTNPMSSLTATLQQCCGNPVSGFCHSYFEIKDVIQKIFELKDWSPISISIAGMNHFTWVTDFKIGREDGYALLRKRIGKGSLQDLIPDESADAIGYFSGHELFVHLYEATGYMSYPANRHICEFVSFAITGNPPRRKVRHNIDGNIYDTFDYCNIRRTPVSSRRIGMKKRTLGFSKFIKDKGPFSGPRVKSRETGAEMIRAYLQNKPFTDAVNVLNIGQIPGLPLGACVETMGMVDGLGVRPVSVGEVPEHLIEFMRPQAVCQKWITQGMLEGDKDLLMQALFRDPQCAHLKPRQIRKMGEELLAANKKFLGGCRIL